MAERARLTGEQETAPREDAGRDTPDWASPTTALVGGWTGHALAGSRGAGPAIGRAIASLQATAGNGAVVQLLASGFSTHHPAAPERQQATHAAASREAANPGAANTRPVVQAADDETPIPAAGEEVGAVPLGGGAPTPGPSWTKIGPPKPASFTVSGTLRQVATALEARPEAGATITSSDLDRETYAPQGGQERITAARFTVFQTVELPTWTDRATATANQQAEWNRFSAAIAAHEAGHVATDKKSYSNAHTKILRTTPAEGDTTWKNLDDKATKDNQTFDAGNDHGRKAGTNINANIDEVTKVP